MSLDYPRAWELARAAAAGAHDPKCSYVQTNGALLCDLACPVISESLEFACEALHGKGGVVVKPFACPGGHAIVAAEGIAS